ncbi:MAG: TolC family protein [Synergistaceae bacterium]|nr:TolC family protein [Synergistaceae bacterium]
MDTIAHKSFRSLYCLFLIAFLTFLGASQAKANEITINNTLLKAVSTNPEIQAKWHSFLASEKELASAQGGHRPRLDLTAGVGRESLDGSGYEGRDLYNYTRDGITLSLNQMIYDGNLTSSKIKKFSHSKKMRYFNLISSIEQTALAALRSHEDVLRYQTLIKWQRETSRDIRKLWIRSRKGQTPG